MLKKAPEKQFLSMVSLLGKSRTEQISVLRSFARPQADGKLKNGFEIYPSILWSVAKKRTRGAI